MQIAGRGPTSDVTRDNSKVEQTVQTKNFKKRTRTQEASTRRSRKQQLAQGVSVFFFLASMAKKEKGATFAQNNDLIEEHLKAAFKAATDANTALREEVTRVRSQIGEDTTKLTALDNDIKKERDEQSYLTKQLAQQKDPALRCVHRFFCIALGSTWVDGPTHRFCREIHETNLRLRNEGESLRQQKAKQAAEIKCVSAHFTSSRAFRTRGTLLDDVTSFYDR